MKFSFVFQICFAAISLAITLFGDTREMLSYAIYFNIAYAIANIPLMIVSNILVKNSAFIRMLLGVAILNLVSLVVYGGIPFLAMLGYNVNGYNFKIVFLVHLIYCISFFLALLSSYKFVTTRKK